MKLKEGIGDHTSSTENANVIDLLDFEQKLHVPKSVKPFGNLSDVEVSAHRCMLAQLTHPTLKK